MLENEVRIQLAGVDHGVFWRTQRKKEGHTGGVRRGQKIEGEKLLGEGGEEGEVIFFLCCSMNLSGLFPNF